MPGMKNDWVYKMWGPNKANEYLYQRQTKEKLTSKLTLSSGTCDCSNKTLTCSYDILDSWHSRIRSYNKKTKQYENWDEWDASSNTPGFDDRVVKKVTIRYNCKDGSYYFGSS